MRELTVRIKFTSPCLGHVKKHYTIRVEGQRKKRTFFVHLRNPRGRVIFLPTWWTAIMRNAADVLSRHHKEVREIRFALEVDGQPRPVPEELFDRHYAKGRYSKHEVFAVGDIVGLTCLVPEANDADWSRRLKNRRRICRSQIHRWRNKKRPMLRETTTARSPVARLCQQKNTNDGIGVSTQMQVPRAGKEWSCPKKRCAAKPSARHAS